MSTTVFNRHQTIIHIFSDLVREYGNNLNEWYIGYSRILNPEKFVRESHNITTVPLAIRSTVYPEDVKIILKHFEKMEHKKIKIDITNRINHLYIYKISKDTIQNP